MFALAPCPAPTPDPIVAAAALLTPDEAWGHHRILVAIRDNTPISDLLLYAKAAGAVADAYLVAKEVERQALARARQNICQ